MKKSYISGSQYVSVCLFPSCERFNKYYKSFLKKIDHNKVSLNKYPHITLLYAPLVKESDIESAIAIIKEVKDKFILDNPIQFNKLYSTSYNTINLGVQPTHSLKSMHVFLVKLLRKHLHKKFLKAFESTDLEEYLLKSLHTSNIGINYQPHMTLGNIKEVASNINCDNIKELFCFKEFEFDMYVNDASGHFLVQKYHLTSYKKEKLNV